MQLGELLEEFLPFGLAGFLGVILRATLGHPLLILHALILLVQVQMPVHANYNTTACLLQHIHCSIHTATYTLQHSHCSMQVRHSYRSTQVQEPMGCCYALFLQLNIEIISFWPRLS